MSVSRFSIAWDTSSFLATVGKQTITSSRRERTLTPLATSLLGSCLSCSELFVATIKPSPSLTETGTTVLLNEKLAILAETRKIAPNGLPEIFP